MLYNNLLQLVFLSTILFTNPCNNTKNNMVKNTSIEPFEIEVYVFTGTPVGPRYFLNEKRLIIKYTSAQVDPATKEMNWKRETILNKDLFPTEELMEISKILIDDYKNLPHEMCTGGKQIFITLKKSNTTKKVHYACAKKYDDYTLKIVHFINSNLPQNKYRGIPISL